MTVDGIEVTITSPDRVLFPKDAITKADLADYYARIAPAMLPHLRGRPINLQRYPRGIASGGFIQQEAPPNMPDWIGRIEVDKEDGRVTHALCENAATLVWLANLSAITLHMWLSCAEHLDNPDRLVLDLDPSGDDFGVARSAARSLKAILDARGLPAYLMSTGSRGLHVVVPLKPNADSDSVRDYAQELAEELEATDPDRLTTEIQKEDRHGRLFIDTLRNAYAHTAVAPYSVRARDGAPVAAPIPWDALDNREFTSRRYTLRDAEKLLEASAGAWKGFPQDAVDLSKRPNRAA